MGSFNVFCCSDKSFLLQLEWMTEDTYWGFVPVSSSWVASQKHPWLNLPPDGCFWKHDRIPEFVLLVLPKILDGLVYISLLEQSGVGKKWKQWWVLQLDIEVLLLVIKVVMVWHFVNDVCKVLWLHTLSGCLQTIVIIVLKTSFSAIL